MLTPPKTSYAYILYYREEISAIRREKFWLIIMVLGGNCLNFPTFVLKLKENTEKIDFKHEIDCGQGVTSLPPT